MRENLWYAVVGTTGSVSRFHFPLGTSSSQPHRSTRWSATKETECSEESRCESMLTTNENEKILISDTHRHLVSISLSFALKHVASSTDKQNTSYFDWMQWLCCCLVCFHLSYRDATYACMTNVWKEKEYLREREERQTLLFFQYHRLTDDQCHWLFVQMDSIVFYPLKNLTNNSIISISKASFKIGRAPSNVAFGLLVHTTIIDPGQSQLEKSGRRSSTANDFVWNGKHRPCK